GDAVALVGGDHVLFVLRPGDLHPTAGPQTLEEAGRQAGERLNDLLRAYSEQRNPELLLRDSVEAAAATLAFLLFLWALYRTRGKIEARLEPAIQAQLRGDVPRLHLRAFLLGLARRLVAWTLIAIGLAGAYVWLAFVFTRFLYTKPWGEKLGAL